MAATGLPLETLLPIHAVDITLRFLTPARLHPFHQPALTAFLRSFLDTDVPYDVLLTLDAPESGRIAYQAGQRYRFTVFALAGGEEVLNALLEQLRQLPESAQNTDSLMPFRDNLAFVAAHDFFKGHPIRDVLDASVYTRNELDHDVAYWQRVGCHQLRWLSPVRLLRAKEQRVDSKGEARYCRDSTDLSFELLAARLHDSFADLLRRRGEDTATRCIPPQLTAPNSELFWVDSRYRNERHREQVMGGLMGLLTLPELTDDNTLAWDSVWGPLWVLGQYCGIGQRRAFGWGRYQLESAKGISAFRRCEPAASLLEQCATTDNLALAYEIMHDNLREKQPDHPAAEESEDELWLAHDRVTDDSDLAARLERMSRQLAGGHYQPPALHGVIIRDNDGGIRPLAIPPFSDRVAQRAVAQVLTPIIEPLLAHGSFGYRPRRSRQTARQAILDAYDEGYRWVYESDIDDFFDSVSWRHLRTRLQAIFGSDPMIELILNWMAAPVHYQEQVVQRSAGLPQGSPLSPLLANLMLDDFDSDLETAGFKLARFADDFVILCKDRDEAEDAARVAEHSLAEVGLRLNQSKTHIRSFNQGFRYLGYVFVNDLALDVGGQKDDAPSEPAEPPPNSWLAQLARRAPQALEPDQTLPKRKSLEPLPTATQPDVNRLGDRSNTESPAGTMLFVTGASTMLVTKGGRLQMRRDESVIADVGWNGLAGIVLIGPQHISTPALRAALKRAIPVHFASSSGRYQGSAWPVEPGYEGWQLWLHQQRLFTDDAQVVDAARSLVDARLRHQREVLRQRSAGERYITAIDQGLNALNSAATLSVLNGVEGRAASAYFSGLQQLVPATFDFTGRNRRPPRDPFNALLSLGYTVLYAHVDTVVRACGLLPWLGFYHRSHGRHAALASDLMEPFRHLVERAALLAVVDGRLQPDDFTIDPEYGCRLTTEARRSYLALLSERFDSPIKAIGDTEAKTLPYHLYAQSQAIVAWVRGNAEQFKAWRQR